MNGTKNGPSRSVLNSLGKDRNSRSSREPWERLNTRQNGADGAQTASLKAPAEKSGGKSKNGNSDPSSLQASTRRLQSKIVVAPRADNINGGTDSVKKSKTHVSPPLARRDSINERKPAIKNRLSVDNVTSHSKESSHRPPGKTRESRNSDFRQNARSYDCRNRHELEAWKRAQAAAQRPRHHFRPLPSPSGRSATTRTGSSLSKRSEASTNNSFSPSSHSSLARPQRFANKDVRPGRSSIKSESRASSASNSASGNDSKQKRLKVNSMTSISKTKEKPDQLQANISKDLVKPGCLKPAWKSFGVWKVECSSTNGRQYFYNTETKKSTWYKPQEWTDAEIASLEVIPSDLAPRNSTAIRGVAKRKLSQMEVTEHLSNPKSTKISKTVAVPLDDVLLGSPISDDNEGRSSAASPTPSERMDISDAEAVSNASISPSKNAATASSRSPPSRFRKSSVEKIRLSSPRRRLTSEHTTKTKAPTMEDLKKLEENDDPDKRRSLKLERVQEWRKQLGGTPTEVSQSPLMDRATGSPVSSDTSTVSPQWPRTTVGKSDLSTDPVKLESTKDLAVADTAPSCPTPIPASACSRIVLPLFDFPDISDSHGELPSLFSESLTTIFSSMKIGHVEDQKCKQLFGGARPEIYTVYGERAVQMMSNQSDIRQKKMTTLSQAEDILFLASLQDELSWSMHSRSDQKPEIQKQLVIKSEPLVDVEIKPDLSLALMADSKTPLSVIGVSGVERCLVINTNGIAT